ncbi:FAD-dependent oxidoreductase [Butyrivibrio sp.]|uniref:FAD-dependent oxidoreductase n=1 Tax=Butyrivibrio sp. TaxID=28121 RepID=UPI0025C45BAC|nr:FAD-dependent oxidoreductase [Butyrivibrio sp.]
MNDLMTPYSLDPNRNRKDPRGGVIPDSVDLNAPFREPLARFSKVVTDRKEIKLGLEKITKESPEYWGLYNLITDEQCEIALKMEKRHPKTFEEIAALCPEYSKEELQKQLDEMSFNGVIEWNYENDKHEKQYVLPMYVPGSAEFGNMNHQVLEKHPEAGAFFERMSRIPLEGLTHMVPMGGAGVGMHVIPVEKAIEMQGSSIDLEHISYWLDYYEGKYAASPCSCRRSRKTFEQGCADDPEGWCIAVGDMADYVVETQKDGRYITKEEALEIFKQAEDNGFVHQITNIDGDKKIFAICNCNVNVCYALRTSQLFNTPNMSRSAYVAHVDKDNCVACGRCVEVCPAGAATLGQKLCKKDGSEVVYPKMPLPTEKKWSQDMWTEDYRDINRINTHKTGTAPCKTACPAHIPVQGYLKMAAQGRYEEALALIKKYNPLPAVCGHVCNRRCEDACTRATIDQAIAIDEVKKFVAMRDLKSDTRYIPKKVIPKIGGGFDEKVAIIGAGPAGISCAYYLALKGYKPTLFDKNKKPGGMVTYGIPSFVMEKDVVEAEVDVLRELGVDIRLGVEVGKDITLKQLREEGYKAFYIAIGCQGGRGVNVPGEDAEGVIKGVDILHAVIDDESYKLNGDTVVIGGGNVAIDVSRTAIRCGSPKITQVSLETRDIMPALPEEIELAESEGIQFKGGWGPKEILTENGKVKGIVFKKCTQVKNAEGRFDPQYDENETMEIACSNVILSVGQATIWGDLLKDENVEFRGPAPVADKITFQTTVPDIFVGGDMFYGPRFAIDAIACGREGAESIHRFVQPHSSLTIGRDPNFFIELDKEDISVKDYDHVGRQVAGNSKKDGEKLTFRDTKLVFTEEQVKKETSRCLGCGASIIDPNKCVGCGLCTTRCEFDAIKLTRDNPDCSTMRKAEDKLKYILPNGISQAIKRPFVKKTPKETAWLPKDKK